MMARSTALRILGAISCVLLGLLGGCRAPSARVGGSQSVIAMSPNPVVTVIRQPRAWGDTGKTSTIDVVVRDVHQPTHQLAVADVLLDGPARVALRTDDNGAASSQSVKPGEYTLTVRRIGYIPLKTRVVLDAGCRVSIEAYLTYLMCDLGPCPPIDPPRVTVTTCGPRTSA